MKKEIICTVCPRGCQITAVGSGDDRAASVSGYSCKRGKAFAEQELFHPERILTTTVRIGGRERELLPVRSAKPLPKETLLSSMAVLKEVTVLPPVRCYEPIVKDICGTGVDIVAVRDLS